MHNISFKRTVSAMLALMMLLTMLPAGAFAEGYIGGLCEHHTEHIDCGYSEGSEAVPCSHVCDGGCYYVETLCVHACGDGSCAYAPAAEGEDEIACDHICSAESGCVITVNDCVHTEHDGLCGYAEALPAAGCGYVCALCLAADGAFDGPENEPESEDEVSPEEVPEAAPDTDEAPAIDEAPEAEELPGDETGLCTVYDWAWVDTLETVSDGRVIIPDASEHNIYLFSDVTALLPAAVSTEYGELAVEWSCAAYPAEGVCRGNFDFSAALPADYVLAETAEKLRLSVVFDAPGKVYSGTFNGLPADIDSSGRLLINENNFPDYYFREFLKDKFGAEQISAENILTVKSLYASEKFISSLEGIEYFSELSYLDCSGNSISELDVSKNKWLSSLYCQDNLLTELDLKVNERLNYINCQDNQISDLTFYYPRTLKCGNNELTSINVNNDYLESLDCSGNLLTSLSVNSELEDLDCSGNLLTSLSIPGSSKLKYLDCYDNALATLDIYGCQKLERLNCQNNVLSNIVFPYIGGSLEYLNCSNNLLSGTFGGDSSCPIWLKQLDCSNNRIEAFGDNFVYVTNLKCNNNRIAILDNDPSIYQPFNRLEEMVCSPQAPVYNGGDAVQWIDGRCIIDLKELVGAVQLPNVSSFTPAISIGSDNRADITDFLEAGKPFALSFVFNLEYQHTSQNVTVNYQINIPPRVLSHPQSVAASGTVSFSVSAFGSGLSYQWQQKAPGGNWAICTASGSKTATLTVSPTSAMNGYQYRCQIKDSSGISVFSDAATLTLAAPSITKQPASVSAAVGTAVKLSVSAKGIGLSYQWQIKNKGTGAWVNSGASTAKSATLSLTATESLNGYSYRCVVTNSAGTVSSIAATLTVYDPNAVPPSITKHPASVTVDLNRAVKLSVTAVGGGLTYQWQVKTATGSWVNSGASTARSATLSLTATENLNSYQYRCIVKNSLGTAVSNAATLTVRGAVTTPKITKQPASVTVSAGSAVKFSVTATGGSLSYRWQVKTPTGSWVNSGASTAKSATLSLTASENLSGYSYRCVVKNSMGSVTSNAVTINILSVPKITKQPVSLSLTEGESASFSVTATGGGLSCQWQVKAPGSSNWVNSGISSAKTANLSFAVNTSHNGYQYRCRVSNSEGTVFSDAATLTVKAKVSAPVITADPASATLIAGQTASLSVSASGTNLSYQWQVKAPGSTSWANSGISSAKTANLSFAVNTSHNGYQYRCRVSNSKGTVFSDAATLTVKAKVSAPVITADPASATLIAGQTASLSVAASGSGLSYQWQVKSPGSTSWANSGITSAKTANLSFTVGTSHNGYQYRCRVSNSAGTVYSDAATLTVSGGVSAPVITSQPSSLTLSAGQTANLSASASGTRLSYQWQVKAPGSTNWANSGIASAKTATLSLTVSTSHNGYQYRCRVSNAGGTVYSDPATLTVSASSTPVSGYFNGSSAQLNSAGHLLINSVNFPDASFRNYISERFDTDGAGYLTSAQVASASYISINGMGIRSLKGIEYFTSLTDLICSQNSLTKLDLSTLPGLEYLSCWGQCLDVEYKLINGIKTIDLSEIIGIENLDKVISVTGGIFMPDSGHILIEEGSVYIDYYYDTGYPDKPLEVSLMFD